MVRQDRISPQPLLQELLWPNRWQCTVACLLLNLTTRKQVDRVWPELFTIAPGPDDMIKISEEKLQELIKPLGMWRIRSARLKKLAQAWGTVPHAKLPGVGKYAWQSDRIFFADDMLWDQSVEDGALTKYLDWRRKQKWKKLK